MDEATMIREQDRLAKEKKKREAAKRRNRILISFGAIVMVVILYLIWGRSFFQKTSSATVSIQKTDSQQIVFVKVNSINGNEIGYTVLDAQEESESEEETPSGFPSGDDFGGERPDFTGERTDFAGEMGGVDFQKSDAGTFGGKNKGQKEEKMNVLSYDGISYILSQDSGTTLIPVGTDVITKLGTKTTFSRIAAGDCLALVTETIDGLDTIMAVYIVG